MRNPQDLYVSAVGILCRPCAAAPLRLSGRFMNPPVSAFYSFPASRYTVSSTSFLAASTTRSFCTLVIMSAICSGE